jgi:hypothetical protein
LELAFVETNQLGCSSTSTSPASQTELKREPVSSVKSTDKGIVNQTPPNLKTSPEPETSDSVNFRQLMDRWSEILSAIYEHDPRTQALLNSSKPLGLEKGQLVIAFRSDLLREKMEKGHNLALVREALKMVLGGEIGVRCVLLDRWQGSGESSANSDTTFADGGMVETALRDLGAQVVDVEQMPTEGQHRSQSN